MTGCWWEDTPAEPVGDSAAPARELVPEGDHAFQIKQVIDSEDRLEVRLVHEDRRYGWVFAKLPKEKPWAKRLAKQLAESLGVAPADWNAFVASGDMAGRRVQARIYHKAGDGRTFVNVGDFMPQAEPEPAKQATTRKTRTQAADAAAGASGDDIPF